MDEQRSLRLASICLVVGRLCRLVATIAGAGATVFQERRGGGRDTPASPISRESQRLALWFCEGASSWLLVGLPTRRMHACRLPMDMRMPRS
jgi:hypothetical protein